MTRAFRRSAIRRTFLKTVLPLRQRISWNGDGVRAYSLSYRTRIATDVTMKGGSSLETTISRSAVRAASAR
jgi:hypothetical protein